MSLTLCQFSSSGELAQKFGSGCGGRSPTNRAEHNAGSETQEREQKRDVSAVNLLVHLLVLPGEGCRDDGYEHAEKHHIAEIFVTFNLADYANYSCNSGKNIQWKCNYPSI